MKRVYKFPISFIDRQTVTMPADAEILCIKMQKDEPCIWAVCDPDAKKEQRIIRCVGTGHAFEHITADYIGTVLIHNDAIVFHFFEVCGE